MSFFNVHYLVKRSGRRMYSRRQEILVKMINRVKRQLLRSHILLAYKTALVTEQVEHF